MKADKGSTILSLARRGYGKTYGQAASKEMPFTNRHKKFNGIRFRFVIIMIVSLIPWNDFGVTIFKGWTSVLTGNSFVTGTFGDLAMWFFLLGIIAALIGRFTEKKPLKHLSTVPKICYPLF